MILRGKTSNKSLLQILLLALLLSFTASSVWAQDEAEDDEEATETEESADLGRIEVTGSLLRREEFTTTSPMQIINADTQAQVGQLTVAEILQNTTVAAGTTQLNNTFNGFVVQGGTGVQTLDLRGLGDNRTLVILDGRRPGGSGTQGQVNAFDLNMIPEIAATRFEIVLDGSSSIYGSDAIAGVANIITRRSFDGFEAQALAEVPFESGGEFYRVGAIWGKIFEKGSFTISAQWDKREALRIRDRDFLSCGQDLVYSESGQRIDREDRSVLAGTPLGGCPDNIYINTVLDAFSGERYIPSPDGVTIGPFPGYRPRTNGRYDGTGQGEAWYNDVLNAEFYGSQMAINEVERFNVYTTFDYAFDFWGGVDLDASLLYSSRETTAENWRQFFPAIVTFLPYENGEFAEGPLDYTLPVMPYPSNNKIDVDYMYFTAGLQGLFPTKNYWSWQVYGSYSKSDGDYGGNEILNSEAGDYFDSPSPPSISYFTPGVLGGGDMQSLINAIGSYEVGNTVYDQYQVVGIIAGDLFELPAGMVGAAFGAEYRDFSIDDQPSQNSQDSNLWGTSSALVTKGSNDVWEAFMELEVPIIAGKKGFEELTLNGSIRTFDYKVGGSDTVWKAGLKWAVTPSAMFRATAGTSYRAPALYELYLGNLTSFLGQLAIDPCINWDESTNSNIRTNCAAEGIPGDYTGAGSSAEITSGGGVENLEPETSDSYTVGFVWTPQFADLSIAFDWFSIEVNNQISQLSASSIISGCYNSTNFPNAFCDLFTRAGDGPTVAFPYNILTVNDSFVNVNEQKVSGVDMNLRWDQDFSYGQLVVEMQSTWYDENVQQLFDPSLVSGFDTTDYVGTVGSPDFLTNLRASFTKNDWTFNWYLQYVSATSDDPVFYDERDSYFGWTDAVYDYSMDAAFYHNISVFYQTEKWDFLVGINNLFDEEPDTYSTGGRSRRGNVPVSATQYDLLGRSLFTRVNFRF
jgi:iron complex outermembrane receptor protein